MKFPTYSIEDSVKRQGYVNIAGVDEVARGTLVGSVVAAAVVIPDDFITKLLYKVNDSKKLSPGRREELYKLITDNCDYGIGEISNEEIDDINIFEATKLAMYSALTQLCTVDYALVDGNVVVANLGFPQQQVIKGDCKSISIASASIIAKVTKDRIMDQLHKEWPQYSWNTNRGYGTKAHVEAIEKWGLTPYHRKSFGICRGQAKNVYCSRKEIDMCKKLLESCCSCKNNKTHVNENVMCCKTDYPDLSYDFLKNGNKIAFKKGLGATPFPCEFYEKL